MQVNKYRCHIRRRLNGGLEVWNLNVAESHESHNWLVYIETVRDQKQFMGIYTRILIKQFK